MDKLKTGSGSRLRTDGLTPVVLPIPYDPAPIPGAIVSVLAASPNACVPFISSAQGNENRWRQVVLLEDDNKTLRLGVSSPADHFVQLFSRNRGAGPGLIDGDILGEQLWRGLSGGGDALGGARVRVSVVGTPTTTSLAARMEIFVTNDGSSLSALTAIATPAGNLLIGNTTGTERLSVTGNIQLTNTADSYKVGTDNVVGSRKTGWAAPTGTANRTTFDTATATTADLAERLKALIDDLTSHGLIGPTP